MLALECKNCQKVGFLQQISFSSKFFFVGETHMGEKFQDYSWIQDFEADFPQKVSLKILN